MLSIDLFQVLLRFLLGGSAVAVSTLIAKNSGCKLGGIFGAFPAVYLATVIGLSTDYKGSDLLLASEQLSKGSLVGMIADICCALAASYMILRYGWKQGCLCSFTLGSDCSFDLFHLDWVLRSAIWNRKNIGYSGQTENWIDHKMQAIEVDFLGLRLRFIFGGAMVAGCFILLQLIPSKAFAGIFAAFPAIMLASVIMAGHFGNSKQASDIALGASAGMLGCAICVLAASFFMEHFNRWGLSLIIALIVWFFSAYAASHLINTFLEKIKGKKDQKQAFKIANSRREPD